MITDEMKRKLVILSFFIFTPMVLLIRYPINGQLLVDGADGILYFNNYSFIWQGIFNGEFPIWNKFLANGQPTVSAMSGTLINFPALFFGWMPMEWFVFFFYCLHISCAAFFMYLFLQEIKCNWEASLAVSAMLLFSIHLGGGRKSHMGIICACALFPAVMYFIQRHINTLKLKYIALAAGVLAFAFTYTQTQHVTYMIVASGFYLVACLIKNRVKPKLLLGYTGIYAFLFFIFSAIVLIPTVELMAEYVKHGANSTVTFDFFKTGSITPLVLIYMIFPRFFENSSHYMPSSEANIEIFIGIIALVVLLYTIKSHTRKNFSILISLGICFITFIYMSVAFIPGFRNIVYNIPVFGGFRIPSRMLFVFLFFCYVIIAIGLTKIGESENMDGFVRFQYRFTSMVVVFASFIMVTTVFMFGDQGQSQSQILKSMLDFARERFLGTLLILFGISVLFIIIRLKKTFLFFNEKRRYNAVLIIICTSVLIETIPFFIATNTTLVNKLDEHKTITVLTENIENGKIYDAFASIDGSHFSIISQHKNIPAELSVINAYTSYNNPLLYRWLSREREVPLNFSGLLTGTLRANDILYFQNDLLSMMGVKYIIDSSVLLHDEDVFGLGAEIDRTSIVNERDFKLAPSIEHVQVHGKSISIIPESYYLIIVEYSALVNDNGFAYIDLYDTVSDSIVREHLILKNNYAEFMIYSGSADRFVGEQYFRMVSYGLTEPITVLQLSLYKIEFEQDKDNFLYTPFIVNEQVRIFKNVNARDILYFADEVKGISDTEYLFKNPVGLNLDTISYIVGAEDRRFDTQNNTIRDINFGYNSISAEITSENGGFLNFSQCYFPGWRVYLNGKREDLEFVNSLIMGVYVPEGTHEVRFVFVSISFIIGVIITCFGIIGCIVVFFVLPRLKLRRNK
jgi:hypothetical protein